MNEVLQGEMKNFFLPVSARVAKYFQFSWSTGSTFIEEVSVVGAAHGISASDNLFCRTWTHKFSIATFKGSLRHLDIITFSKFKTQKPVPHKKINDEDIL